jgi:hypothetical protein
MQARRGTALACLAAAALLPAGVPAADTLHAQGTTQLRQVAPPASRPLPAASAAPQDCRARWEAYQRSQACFAPYRTADAGMKPEAFAVCGPALPDPSPDCGPLR